MKQHLGMLLQLIALGALPSLIVAQIFIPFNLLVMPAVLLVAVVVFTMGTQLRNDRWGRSFRGANGRIFSRSEKRHRATRVTNRRASG